MSDSVRPHRRQPTRPPRPWDSPGKNTGVGCHFLLQCMKGKSESEVAQSCPSLLDPMDCSLPGSSAMGFSRQEYWSGVPLPSLRKCPSFILLQVVDQFSQHHLLKRLSFLHCIVLPPLSWASLVAQTVKRLPAMWEIQVRSLG